jgi:hypothetical protein
MANFFARFFQHKSGAPRSDEFNILRLAERVLLNPPQKTHFLGIEKVRSVKMHTDVVSVRRVRKDDTAK